jgi:hypothetical protein
MTTRMRLGIGMPLADVAALPVYGRGWRRRLALLSGLAQAAAVAPGNGEPATRGSSRPERVWPQAKDGDHGSHQQQPSCHRRPLRIPAGP